MRGGEQDKFLEDESRRRGRFCGAQGRSDHIHRDQIFRIFVRKDLKEPRKFYQFIQPGAGGRADKELFWRSQIRQNRCPPLSRLLSIKKYGLVFKSCPLSPPHPALSPSGERKKMRGKQHHLDSNASTSNFLRVVGGYAPIEFPEQHFKIIIA